MNLDRPLIGIFFMLGFCILAPLGDALAKILGGTNSVVQIVAVRFFVQAVVLTPIVLLSKRSFSVSSRVMKLTVVRTVLHVIALCFMFLSLLYLPLADAIAIAYVMPFLVLILGWLFLNEVVGRYRMGACAVGFLGTMLVVQPNFAAFGPPALLPLLVAVLFAFFMLTTRQIARESDPITLQAISGIVATILLLPALYMGDAFGFSVFKLSMPTSGDVILLMCMALLGTGAHLCITSALRYAPSATLAPMQYLEIPAATIIGWLIFSDLPNGLAALGIATTVLAGLYIIHRERLADVAQQ